MSGVPRSLEQQLQARRLKRPAENAIMVALAACAAITVVTTVLIIVTLFEETLAFFREVAPQRVFLETQWSPQLLERYGIWSLVAGTVSIVFWSLLFALPLGLAAAVYLSEYAHPRTRRVLKPVLEALAGVPTVVYAFFALNFVTTDVLRPLFGDERVGVFNALGASLVMAVMILPTIASVSEDAMAAVPSALREGAYGLGATRLEVSVRVVFPAALSGIFAAVLLAIARVVGETMIVAVAAGSTPRLTLDPFQSIQTMTGYMLQIGTGDAARGTIDYSSIFAVGAVLFLMTFAVNVAAQWIVGRFREVYE